MVRLEGTEFTWCYEITTHTGVRATMRAGLHTEGADLDNLPGVVMFEQVLACCEMEVREKERDSFSGDDAMREEVRASERERVKVRE